MLLIDLLIRSSSISRTTNHSHRVGWSDKRSLLRPRFKPRPTIIIKMEENKLTKADEQMLRNFRIAVEIVLIEDRKLFEELGKC